MKMLYKITGIISLLTVAVIFSTSFLPVNSPTPLESRSIIPTIIPQRTTLRTYIDLAIFGLAIVIIVLCIILLVKSKGSEFSKDGPIWALASSGTTIALFFLVITTYDFLLLIILTFMLFPVLPFSLTIGGIMMIKTK